MGFSQLLVCLCACAVSAFNRPALSSGRSTVPAVTRARVLKGPSMSEPAVEEEPVEEVAAPVQASGSSVFDDTSSSKVEQSDAPVGGLKQKGKRINNMFNEKGEAYAPWMVAGLADSADIAARERERRDKKNAESTQVFGDVQAQELSGTGLSFKLIDDEVEVSWGTNDETDNVGYIVQKRKAGAASWETLRSYKDWQPLASKGINGGNYKYLDTTSEPGSWYYRVLDCDDTETESFVCQCLVEIQTSEEKFGTLIAVGAIGAVLLTATAIGVALDPQ